VRVAAIRAGDITSEIEFYSFWAAELNDMAWPCQSAICRMMLFAVRMVRKYLRIEAIQIEACQALML
jgi:hypothetical protein